MISGFHGGIFAVSIHAPVWGATQPGAKWSRPHTFQSTRPCGARRSIGISIFDQYRFNPRARVGRDKDSTAADKDDVVSIHAPVWGATLYPCPWPAWPLGFNPRARVGRDLALIGIICCSSVSIHAPVWGATMLQPDASVHGVVSIHAPVWGATAPRLRGCFY